MMLRSVASLFALLCLAPAVGSAAGPPAGVVPDQYIVVLRDDVPSAAAAAQDMGRTHGLALGHVYENALKGYMARIPARALTAVERDPRVDFVTEDREVVAFQDAMPAGVHRVGAAGKVNVGSGVHVAVIDTGIDLAHPDLKAGIVGGKDCTGGTSYADGNGHGTHVAGIVGARRNSLGVVGVAPAVSLWAVRVLDNSGAGTMSSVICGVDFVDSKSPARKGPIVVANMSLGGSGADDGNCGRNNKDALHKAICAVVADGVTFVVAAGNSGAPVSGFVPAAYDEVLTVTALGDSNGWPCGGGSATSYSADDAFASFSNYASTAADLAHTVAAPGVSIYSTYLGGGYAVLSGTSMASPHVAGGAALYVATHPRSSPSTVKQALRGAGEPVNTNFLSECSAGVSHTDPSRLHPEPVLRVEAF